MRGIQTRWSPGHACVGGSNKKDHTEMNDRHETAFVLPGCVDKRGCCPACCISLYFLQSCVFMWFVEHAFVGHMFDVAVNCSTSRCVKL